MSHTVNSMQLMLRICDRFADEFDVKFNCQKSIATRVGVRFNVNCGLLQLANKNISYVTEFKYLGVHVVSARTLKFSVDHLRVKFYRMFNQVYSKSKSARSEIVTVELMKVYCLPFLLYATEATLLSSTCINMLENCINRALYKIFGRCDNYDAVQFKQFLGLNSVCQLIEERRNRFVGRLMSSDRFITLLCVSTCDDMFT